MSHIPSIVFFKATSVDAKTVAATQIGTTLANTVLRFHPMFAVIYLKTVDTMLAAATLSFGTNASTYNNIIAATAMTGLTTANDMFRSDITGVVASIASGTAIFVNVTVGATATTELIDVFLYGYYQ